jgi:hypothetical protein
MNLGKVGQPSFRCLSVVLNKLCCTGLPNFTQVCARGKVSVLEYYRQKLSDKTNTAWLSCTFGEKAGLADSFPENVNREALLGNDFVINQLCLSP